MFFMLKWFHKKAKKKIIGFALYCAHIVHTVQKYVNFNQIKEWTGEVFFHLSQKVNCPWHQFWTILKKDRGRNSEVLVLLPLPDQRAQAILVFTYIHSHNKTKGWQEAAVSISSCLSSSESFKSNSSSSSSFQQWLQKLSEDVPLEKGTCAPASIHCHSRYEISHCCSGHQNLSPTYI